ncbi:glycosyltransferase family 4 protein [Salegentibacter mishustinae]|uniref:glycosyltransferase family 4 protein n=1 Tax=Salegentibacter mishustinae TaxID=270918 RepID=UPI00248FB2BA|nr:glycosyltransferase family 4 protein [Salegentibacter mishustinae]
MKILFIAPRFHPNQIDLVRKLKEENHEVFFLVLNFGPSEDHRLLKPQAIPVLKSIGKFNIEPLNNSMNYFKVLPHPSEYFRILKNIKPDVVILRGGMRSFYSKLLLGYSFRKNLKIICYTQMPQYLGKKDLRKKLLNLFETGVSQFKTYTPVKYNAKEGAFKKLNNLDYIPFFVYPNTKEIKEISENEKMHFLCIGKYEERKNLKLFIQIAKALKSAKFDFKITIIGGADSEKRLKYHDYLSSLINEFDLSQEIILLKNVLKKNMFKYFEAAHVFILPSRNEPASISQLEAMSYGLPIICSIDNGTAHYVKNELNGFLVNPDQEEVLKAMNNYLLDPGLVAKHSFKSLELVNSDFSINSSYQKFIQFLKK